MSNIVIQRKDDDGVAIAKAVDAISNAIQVDVGVRISDLSTMAKADVYIAMHSLCSAVRQGLGQPTPVGIYTYGGDDDLDEMLARWVDAENEQIALAKGIMEAMRKQLRDRRVP